MNQVVSGDGGTSTPRTVLRGVPLQLVHVGLDSLYLVVEYPADDVYRKWANEIGFDLDNPDLYQGIPCEEYLVRRGNLGYKLAVWDGDARLHLTDRVADNGPQGMGMLLQLGPKWLAQFGDFVAPRALRANVEGQLQLFGVREPLAYPIRINRLDLAVDVRGLRLEDFSVDAWRQGWVGYSKLRKAHFSLRTGVLEGLHVGSRKGAVQLRVYDKVAKAQQDGTLDFWRTVWDMAPDDERAVTRFEWVFKCYAGKFEGMQYLSELTFVGVLGLLNYAMQKWVRLCVPQGDDSNKSRWPLAPLWAGLQEMLAHWAFDYRGLARRVHKRASVGLNYDYQRHILAQLAGLQARASLVQGRQTPVTLKEALEVLGERVDQMDQSLYIKASNKLAVLSRQAGSQLANNDGDGDEEGGDED